MPFLEDFWKIFIAIFGRISLPFLGGFHVIFIAIFGRISRDFHCHFWKVFDDFRWFSMKILRHFHHEVSGFNVHSSDTDIFPCIFHAITPWSVRYRVDFIRYCMDSSDMFLCFARMGESHPNVCTVCFPGTCNRPREWGFELSSASLKETMFHLYIKWKGQDKNPRTPFAMQYLCHYTTGSRTQPQQVSCIPKGDDVSPLHQVERSR